ncbi:YdeI/OmpD-associated family protein [Paenibacillus sp. PR3]|uniref:YdeI/OmpD-associated family protein n=1 Tax=Paenibacillus terricola TaxID=2763503 RepID=A0ABR8N0J0_9BACL|nr:YdeI family protein [Paenibacillus terricola]MBD3921046.1 YdeI/OmpD-associated family protein [Paenibacillus terricola]
MAASRTNPKVDAFIERGSKWKEEYKMLRAIALNCQLTEELKWGVPCYTSQGKNIVLIHGFKQYCAVLFHKGALLSDPDKVLIQQTENVQAARQIRFTNVQEVEKLESTVQAYIYEAIEAERSGMTVEFKKPTEFVMAEEFRTKLDEVEGLKDAFEALTAGRQRAYLLHFSDPKTSKTRAARVEKYIPKILAGKGIYD